MQLDPQTQLQDYMIIEILLQKLSEELFMKQKFLKVLLKWKDQLSQKDLRNYFPFQEYILHINKVLDNYTLIEFIEIFIK